MSKISRAVALQMAGFALILGAAAFLAQHYDLVHVLGRMQQRLGAMEWWGALLYRSSWPDATFCSCREAS